MAYTPSGGSGDLGFGMTFTLVDNFSAVADKIESRFSSFAKAAQDMAKDVNSSMNKMADAMKKFDSAFNGFGGGGGGRSGGGGRRGGGGGNDSISSLVPSGLGAISNIMPKFQNALASGQTSLGEFRGKLNDVGYSEYELLSSTLNTSAAIKDVSEKTLTWEQNLRELHVGIGEITAGLGLLLPVKWGLEQAAKFELIDIRLKTLLGSASEAKRVFDNLKADEPYMPFNIETLLKGNTALIAAKVSADDARSAVKAVANAVAANGGGNAEMDRALATLKKTKELGYANKQRINQFSTGAQIPIYELLHESTGRSIPDLIKKGAIITYDEIVNAFKVAMGKGGLYENALGNMAQSISGKLTTLKTQVMFFWNEIGQSSMGTFHAIINLAINLLTVLNKFLATPMGRFIGGIAQGILILTSLSLAFHGAGRAFGALVRMAGGEGQTIFTMIKSFGAATWKWGLGLVALAVIFETINKAMNAWAMASDKVGTSFTKFEKFGGLLTAFYTIFTGMDENFNFNMPEEMYNKLKNAGLLETVQNLATHIVTLKVFLSGVAEGFMYVFDIGKQVFNGLINVISFFFGMFHGGMNKAQDDLDAVKWAGKALGVALFFAAVTASLSWIGAGSLISGASIIAFLGWVVRSSITVAALVADAVTIGISWLIAGGEIAAAGIMAFIAWLPILAIPLLIIAAIALIGYAIYELYTHFDQVKKWFIDMGEIIYVAGTYFVNSFLDGIKSAWHSVIDFFSNAWNTLPEWIRKPLEVGFNLYNAPVGAASDLLFGTDYLSQNNNVKTIQTATQQAAPQMMYSGGGGQQDSNKPIILHSYLHVDGNEMGKSVQQYNTRQEQRASHGDR